MDYRDLIPEIPTGFEEWAKRIHPRTNYITWKIVWMKHERKKSERVAECVCQFCGCQHYRNIYDGFIEDAYYSQCKNGEIAICPQCNTEGELRHTTKFFKKGYNSENQYAYLDFIDEHLCVVQMNLQWFCRNHSKGYWSLDVHRYLIFTPRKVYRYDGYSYYGWYPVTGEKVYNGHLFEKIASLPKIPRVCKVFPIDDSMFKGTKYENSKIPEFLKLSFTRVDIVEYLNFLRKKGHHSIEKLFNPKTQHLIEDTIISPSLIDWKAKTAFKMIGVDRDELNELKGFSLSEISETIRYRNCLGFKIKRSDAIKWRSVRGYNEFLNMPPKTAYRTINYLYNQHLNIQYYQDYISMAGDLGYNMENPIIVYPKNLREKHDKVTKEYNFVADELNKKKFFNLASEFECVSFKDKKYCIRIAYNEQELIDEGAILKHCVGGYAKSHLSGKSIFFIRLAETPEVPYYTLQIDIKTGEVLQLHDYENRHSFDDSPKDIQNFINKWTAKFFKKIKIAV